MYQGIETGVVDIGYSHVYYTPGRMPVTEFCGLPFGFPSAWVASHVVNDFYLKVRPKEWDKVRLLWFNGSAPNSILTASKPVRTLEDLKGLKIRAPSMVGEIIDDLGGTPTPTPVVEVYDTMAKGVNDGAYLNYEVLKTFRLAEVTKYTTECWQTGSTYPFYMAMNKNSYKKLPPDLKEIFDLLCGEYAERYALMWNEIEFGGVIFGLQKGVQFIDLSDEEAAKWKKAVQPLFEVYTQKLVKQGFAESEVKSWISYLNERIEYYTKKQIEWRIPSPTGPAAMRPANIAK
jgi:TRAP-type C4-dicarboxylate transport system substrate-binding protein